MARLDMVQNFVKPRPMRNTPMGAMADIAKRAQSRQGSQLANAACDELAKVGLDNDHNLLGSNVISAGSGKCVGGKGSKW